MEHNKLPDPVAEAIRSLEKQIKENEEIIKILLDKHDLCLNDDIFEDVECGDLFEKEGD